MKLPDVAFEPIEDGLIPSDLSNLARPTKRLMSLLQSGSDTNPSTASKKWSLDFCLSPTEFVANESDPSRVARVIFEKTQLSSVSDPRASTTATGETLAFSSSLVFRSIGYKSIALDGFSEAGIQFDHRRGVIVNDGLGRVVRDLETKKPLPGIYCAGWVKRGPTGVIASTMQDAFATADTIVEDLNAGAPLLNHGGRNEVAGWSGVRAETPGGHLHRVVSWPDWQAIDLVEKQKGAETNRERIKFTDTRDMLAVLD